MGRSKKVINPEIGKRIHEAIAYSKLSRREIARRLDYGDSNIKRLEDGNGEPSTWFMEELSKITGVRIQYLYCIDDFKTWDDVIKDNYEKRIQKVQSNSDNVIGLLNACGYTFNQCFIDDEGKYCILPDPPLPNWMMDTNDAKDRDYEQLDKEWEEHREKSIYCICKDGIPLYRYKSPGSLSEIYEDCTALISTILKRSAEKEVIIKIIQPCNCPYCSDNVEIIKEEAIRKHLV